MKNNEKERLSECTSILVGRKMTNDGSFIIARSEDWNAMECKHFEMFERNENAPTQFRSKDTGFECEVPSVAYAYTALPPYNLHGHWGSSGYNEHGVGMSATESIFSNDKVLAKDPWIHPGVAEDNIQNIVLPYIKTAREGVLLLGDYIEKYGAAEGNGVSFVDNNEIWYLEVACGHRWMAARLPEDVYFVSGNQGRLREYNPNDKENFLGSKDLIEFAQKVGTYNAKKGEFDFHEAYSRDIDNDLTYNYPRVWGLQKMLSPKIKNDVTKNTFPVYAKADHKITIEDMRRAFRFHYQGTEHDPYLNSNPKEPYRPVSIFRTTQTHIMQVRPEMPKEVGEVNYVALGMAALSLFVPYYQGLDKYIEGYDKGANTFCDDSVYWKFKKVQTLAMVNFNKYAPIVQKTYADFEAETDQRQKEMEADYMKLYKKQPMKAHDLLQEFSEKVMRDSVALTEKLINRLFTELCKDIQAEYLFHGA